MNIPEAAYLLRWSREQIEIAISAGVKVPGTDIVEKLEAGVDGHDISEASLDKFINEFEKQEPGRHPPVAIRRELLIESKHRCAICWNTAPIQFHHMLEFGKINHHDPQHMLAICGTCHDMCSTGKIDYKCQCEYKRKLRAPSHTDSIELKRSADLKTLEMLFSFIPRKRISAFFEEAGNQRLHYYLFDEIELSEMVFYDPTFHLYDTCVWDALKTFFFRWEELREISGRVFHAEGLLRYAKIHSFANPDDVSEFFEKLKSSRGYFATLNTMVRNNFPDFDMTITDKVAAERIEEEEKAAEERIKIIVEKMGTE